MIVVTAVVHWITVVIGNFAPFGLGLQSPFEGNAPRPPHPNRNRAWLNSRSCCASFSSSTAPTCTVAFYWIMNRKRDVVERFIELSLPAFVTAGLDSG